MQTTDQVIQRLKALVEKGNVERILIKNAKNDIILNIPVNVGAVGGILGLAAVPWVMIGAVIAGAGFGYKIEIKKPDGDIVDVTEETQVVEQVEEIE